MSLESDTIEIIVEDPHMMLDDEWTAIKKIARRFKEEGIKDRTKCVVLAYLEWAGVGDGNQVQ